MTEPDEIFLEKEAAQIEAELGEEHLVRMLQCLTSNSPEASRGLVELHTQCRNVVSKRPPIKTETEKPKQRRTPSQGATRMANNQAVASRTQKVRTEKPRIMITKRTHTLVPHNVQKNIAA
ncbi:hypothetical protein COOONC_11211 [Cooperia oncophora]